MNKLNEKKIKKPLILIIDDQPGNIKILDSTLKKNNFNTLIIEDPKKTVEITKKINPDLILLDIIMPKIDGYEVCKNLKEDKKTKEIPILFLSAKDSSEDKIKGFNIGALDYITKPFNPTELLARVKTHVELKQSREKLLKAYKELKIAATIDPLTKILNRGAITERLKEEQARFNRNGEYFSIIMGDIDNFKKFNDTYGHDCGDIVLREVATTLKKSLRRQDAVGRWGGEEFLIILSGTAQENSFIAAEKLRKKIEDLQVIYEKQKLNITITLGLTDIDKYTKNIDEFIKIADNALYKGKNKGKNKVIKI